VIQLPDLADIRRADRVQIADYVRRLASITNQVDALMGAAVSKVEAEGIKAVHQYSSSAAWLSDVALMAQALANRIVARAHAVNPSYTLDGTEIPAVAPLAGVAAREGAISPGHVEVIADKMAQIPATVSDDDRAGAEKILVDNMSTVEIREAVLRARKRAKIEISGGVTLERIPQLAATGADFVSVGALTHSAPAIDISFEIEPV